MVQILNRCAGPKWNWQPHLYNVNLLKPCSCACLLHCRCWEWHLSSRLSQQERGTRALTGSDSRRCHLLGWQSSTWFSLYCAATATAGVFLWECRRMSAACFWSVTVKTDWWLSLTDSQALIYRCGYILHLQILTFNKAGRLRSTVKISCVLFVFLFCVSYSFGAKWEPKSWTDCVYTLSSALGDACHGANALCWLCVWHSYITNTSHWGPQSGDCLSFCLPENGTEMGEFLKITSGPSLSLFFCVPRQPLK